MRTIQAIAISALCIASLAGRNASAQEYAPPPSPRMGADSVISTTGIFKGDGASGAVTFDVLGGWRLASRLDILARPVVTKKADGSWDANLYQLALRYTRPGNVQLRVDAGYLPSPIGILALESRADLNPVIIPATSYAATLPIFEAGTPAVQLFTANYPLALQVTSSGTHWDARGAVLGSSPARVRPLTGDDYPPSSPQLAFGGGITPHIGLRLGASMSHGRYARAEEVADPSTGDRMGTVMGLDADYSVGFTRVYADYVHGRYDRATDSVTGTSLTLTAVRTLSPRWYVSARGQRQTTSDMLQQPSYGPHDPTGGGGYGGGGSDGGDGGYGGGAYGVGYGTAGHGAGYVHAAGLPQKAAWTDLGGGDAFSVQAVVGFRVNSEITLRAGYVGYRAFGSDQVGHGAACSIVWAHRWW